MAFNWANSSKVSTGWLASKRNGGLVSSMPNKLGFGPINVTKDMTNSSRIGSIGGLVTCANSCLK